MNPAVHLVGDSLGSVTLQVTGGNLYETVIASHAPGVA